MSKSGLTGMSLLLAAPALGAATLGFALLLPAGGDAADRLARSTNAILEDRAA